MEQPEVALTTEAITRALDTPIAVPDECICDYATIMPYNLSRRLLNPDCTAHTADEPEELERDR